MPPPEGPLPMARCPRCGAPVDGAAKNCLSCGADLSAPASPPEAVSSSGRHGNFVRNVVLVFVGLLVALWAVARVVNRPSPTEIRPDSGPLRPDSAHR